MFNFISSLPPALTLTETMKIVLPILVLVASCLGQDPLSFSRNLKGKRSKSGKKDKCPKSTSSGRFSVDLAGKWQICEERSIRVGVEVDGSNNFVGFSDPVISVIIGSLIDNDKNFITFEEVPFEVSGVSQEVGAYTALLSWEEGPVVVDTFSMVGLWNFNDNSISMASSNNEGDAAGSSVTMSCNELDEDGFGVDSLALLCQVTVARNSIEVAANDDIWVYKNVIKLVPEGVECPCDEDYFDFEFPSLV